MLVTTSARDLLSLLNKMYRYPSPKSKKENEREIEFKGLGKWENFKNEI